MALDSITHYKELVGGSATRVVAVFERPGLSMSEGFPRTLRYVGFRVLPPDSIPAPLSSDKFFVCGDASGRVFAYDWTEVVKRSDAPPKTVFSFSIFDGIQSPVSVLHEVNGLLYCSETERLYVGGAGDNAVRDASVDGTVRVWDVRKDTEGHVIFVADEAKVSRPKFGKCVSALAVDNKFMVCGGGVDLGIWHVGMYSLATPMEAEDVRHLTCEMTTDKILAGSMHPILSQWDHAGKKLSNVYGKPKSIYSILQTSAVSFTAGDSNLIDVYLNLGYVAFSLDAFPIE
uniref:WD_REPEATS_REGION domain-containing protein n=1 Tax=Angiostrongylus cantonensis TaxID=6313 RepID=A0A0K0DF68_ANGCA